MKAPFLSPGCSIVWLWAIPHVVSSELVLSLAAAHLSIMVDTHQSRRPRSGSRAWPLASLVHASQGHRRSGDWGAGGGVDLPLGLTRLQGQFGSFFCLNHQDRQDLRESQKGICFQQINIFSKKKSGKYPRELLVYTGQAEAI